MNKKHMALTATVLGGLLVASAAFAQTTGGTLTVGASAPTNVAAGAQDASILTLALSNPGTAPVMVTSIPVAFSDAGILSDCRFQNTGSTGAGLNTGGNVLSVASMTNRIMLDSPLTVNAGSAVSLSLHCDVASAVESGKLLGVAIQPAYIMAMSNGATTTITSPLYAEDIAIGGGTVTPTTPPTTPGIPDTGAGGSLPIYLGFLTLAAMLGLAGAYQMRRTA